jgi:hypothetical protein
MNIGERPPVTYGRRPGGCGESHPTDGEPAVGQSKDAVRVSIPGCDGEPMQMKRRSPRRREGDILSHVQDDGDPAGILDDDDFPVRRHHLLAGCF